MIGARPVSTIRGHRLPLLVLLEEPWATQTPNVTTLDPPEASAYKTGLQRRVAARRAQHMAPKTGGQGKCGGRLIAADDPWTMPRWPVVRNDLRAITATALGNLDGFVIAASERPMCTVNGKGCYDRGTN